MLSIKQRENKRKYKNSLIVSLVITLVLFSSLIPFLDDNFIGAERHNPEPAWYDPYLPDYLYEDSISKTNYSFNAYNHSYIMCKIQNTAYTSFTFNGTTYNVSYGINTFPVDFGAGDQSYSIIINQDDVDNNIFDWICVEPLFIKEDVIEVNTTSTYDIFFDAGGPITILAQPVNFSYNHLYVEVDGTVINEVYDTTNYEEVDPALLSYIMFSGGYIQYDLFLNPGQHTLKFKGNGTLDFKIMASSDWDGDYISDVEEVQNMMLWNYYDPVKPIVWGFYELGSDVVFVGDVNEKGRRVSFNFYLPKEISDTSHISLVLNVGEVTNISIDDNDLFYKGISLTSGLRSRSMYLGCFSEGFHRVSFSYEAVLAFNGYFTCNGKLIPILEKSEVLDTDSDGLTNVNEAILGSDPNIMDTDSDGLIDGIDNSPITAIEFGNDEIFQVVMDHDPAKNTMITVSIERPEEGDYYVGDPMIWRENTEHAMEVSIVPTLRIFGNQSISTTELETTWDKEVITYNLTGSAVSDVVGDNLPRDIEGFTEYDIIMPNVADNSFEYVFIYKKGHDAKIDGIIDLRFDVVWSVFQTEVNRTKLIHHYDFDNDLTIQFITKYEIDNISYILASPDSLIENKILWNLVQNSELGNFADFGISEVDDIDGSGNIDYLNLSEQLVSDREQNPISVDLEGNINETEILYLAGELDIYDILQKVKNSITWEEVPDNMKYLGDSELFFSCYSVGTDETLNLLNFDLWNGVFGDQASSFGRSWKNYSLDDTGGFEKRVDIFSFPVDMNRIENYDDAEILEVKSVTGSDIPLGYFPKTLDEINYDKIKLINSTIIERDSSYSGKPSIDFDLENDECKELEETRRTEIPLSTLVFTEYSFSLAAFLKVFRERVTSMMTNLELFMNYDLRDGSLFIEFDPHTYTDPDFVLIDAYNLLKKEGFSKGELDSIFDASKRIFSPDFDGFTTEQKFKIIVIVLNFWNSEEVTIRWKTLSNLMELQDTLGFQAKMEELREELNLVRMWSDYFKMFQEVILRLDDAVENELFSGIANIGAALFIFWETLMLFMTIEAESDNDTEFIFRIVAGLARIVLVGALLRLGLKFLAMDSIKFFLSKGVMVFHVQYADGSFGLSMAAESFQHSLKMMTYAVIALYAILAVIDIIIGLADLHAMDLPEDIFWQRAIFLIVQTVITFAIPLILTLCGYPLLGMLASLLLIIFWSSFIPRYSYLKPQMSILQGDDETYISIDTDKLKRKGGLEVGDQIDLTLGINNTGEALCYFIANFSAGGSTFSGCEGNWSDGYNPEDTDSLDFSRTLPSTSSYLELVIGVKSEAWLFGDRQPLYNDKIRHILENPILDTEISAFYDDLTDFDKPQTYTNLIQELELLEDSYDHNKRSELLDKLSMQMKYDFLGEDIGEIPPDWDLENNSEREFTVILRPDGDVVREWDIPSGGTHWNRVNDDVLQPYINDIDVITAYWEIAPPPDPPPQEIDVFSCTDPDPQLNVIGAKSVTLWLYGYNGQSTYADMFVYISFDGGDNWSDRKPLEFPRYTDMAWRNVTWTFSIPVACDLTDFQIKIEEPDSGYWSSADSVAVNVIYAEITVNSDVSSDFGSQLVASYKGHNKVMKMEAYGESAKTEFYNSIPQKNLDTIEFWMCKDNYSNFEFQHFFTIDRYGTIYETDRTTSIRPKPITMDEWNHYRIDFTSSTFDLYLNGIMIGESIDHDFTTSLDLVNFSIYNDFFTEDSDKTKITRCYIDAVDYSWHTDYYPYRSYAYDYSLANITTYTALRNEQVINTSISTDLSEKIVEMSSTTHEAIYSFNLDLVGTENPNVNISLSVEDGFTLNVTSILNTPLQNAINFKVTDTGTYEFPFIYYVEMNITIGDDLIYTENVPFKILVVEDFQITQSNIIFEEDGLGDYTATYDFLGDTGNPDWWTCSEPGSTSIEIISNLGDHNDVVEIYDPENDEFARLYNNFDSAKKEGTIEWWFRTIDATKITSFQIGHTLLPGQGGVYFIVQDDILKYNSYGWINIDKTIIDNTWYHFKVDFDIDSYGDETDDWHLFVDGLEISPIEGYDFMTNWQPSGGFNGFQIRSSEQDYGYYSYIDAVGYSWDSDYYMGKNLFKTVSSTEEYQSTTQLEKGDVFFAEYRTNSYAEITMDFLNNDIIQGTYTLVPRGNLYQGIQYTQIIIDEAFSFDKIEFSEHVNNYIEIYHISIIDASATVSEQFNPLNFTNNGNVPEFVSLDFSGIMDTIENSTEYDTGWVEAQTLETVDRDGKRTWSNPSNAKLEDGNNAITDISKLTYSDWLRLTNFYNSGTGYEIPIGAEITGIEVMIKRKGEAINLISDSSLRLRKTSGQLGDDKASGTKYTTTLTWATYGSSSDDWNTGLTSSDLNSADFGIDLSLANSHTKLRRMGYVDAIFIKIHYKIYGEDIEAPYEPQIVTILPNESNILNLDLNLPNDSFSNLFWRGITYSRGGTNEIYNIYVDNLEIDGIHIVSPANRTHFIYGKTITSGIDEISLTIIPEENLVWSGYSLDGQANITFSGKANVTLPETEGLHSIQVFGNNSQGTIFQSEIRKFTIEYIPIFSGDIPYGVDGISINYFSSLYIENFTSYSLDGGNTKSIENNMIDSCCVGTHSIIFYGQDKYGDNYRSKSHSFIVSPITYEMPEQPNNFTLTEGVWDTYGNLERIDGDYSIIETDNAPPYQTIRPNSDITTQWYYTTGTNYYTEIDDATFVNPYDYIIGDYSQGDDGEVVSFGFSTFTIPDGKSIQRVEVVICAYLIGDPEDIEEPDVSISWDNGMWWSTEKPDADENQEITNYNQLTYIFDNLNQDQSDLNSFAVRVRADLPGTGQFGDAITILWMGADMYYAQYEIDVQIDIHVNHSYLDTVLSLDYSHKTSASATVDLDIWNWASSTWYEIESVDNTATFDDDSFQFGSDCNYISSTNEVRIRFQASELQYYQLWIDRLRLTYSIVMSSVLIEDNYTLTQGTWNTIGDLKFIDGNYSTIKSEGNEGGSESYWGTIHPNGDVITDWNEGDTTPHWSKLDEAPEDNDGDGGNVKETGAFLSMMYNERQNYEDVSFNPGETCTRIRVYVYARKTGTTSRIVVTTSLGGYQWFNPPNQPDPNKIIDPTSTFAWYYGDFTGNWTEAQIDALCVQMDATHNTPVNPNGQCDVEAIYVEVYTTRQSYCGLDAQIDIQVDDQDCYYVPTLQYSYKTNISTIVDFDIWNWETSSWDEIESVNNYDSFDDDYFTFLVEGRYVNATLGVRVRFQATASNHFQLEIDRLRLDYLADYS